jgi:hypothetical protein
MVFLNHLSQIVGEHHKMEQQSGPLRYLTLHQKIISEFNEETLNQGSLTETLSGLKLRKILMARLIHMELPFITTFENNTRAKPA